jgi:ABC-2 type transport system permease protein
VDNKPAQSEKIPTMWSVIKWEIRSRRWSVLWWTVGIMAFNAINISVYPSFRDQAAQYDQIFSQMPQAMRNMFSDTGEFMSPVGYLSSQIFYMLLPLLLSILCIGLGSSLIAREEQNKTIELLLSRPISRGKLLLGKLLAGFGITLVVGTAAGILTATMVSLVGFDGITFASVVATTMYTMLLCILFGMVAFALTATGTLGRCASIAIASLVAVTGYVITSLDKTVDWLRFPAKLFPYHYFKPAEFLSGNYNLKPAACFAAVIIGLVVASWVAFRRRDIE